MVRARSKGKEIAYVDFQASFDQKDFRDAAVFIRACLRSLE